MKLRAIVGVLAAAALLAACERPPMKTTQQGWRGTGMEQVVNPRIAAQQQAAVPTPPDLPPPGSSEGPRARDVLQNVKVLGDLPLTEFTRHMAAITAWVAPVEGCGYCHTANFAEDTKYTKVVARRMLEMTQSINVDWKRHTGQTGVTCYTCHRGKPVPAYVTYAVPPAQRNIVGPGLGEDAGQNKADPAIAFTSLPYDPFTPMLTGTEPIRVQGTTALPTGNRMSIKQAEWTYSLMNHMSQALGVNCTFCHNTQSFQTWNDKRVTAWHGIQMARNINASYLEPLTSTFPAARLGPLGDVAKVACSTCHQGVNKPLGGLQMAKDYSGLLKPAGAASAAAPSEPALAAAAAPGDGRKQ